VHHLEISSAKAGNRRLRESTRRARTIRFGDLLFFPFHGINYSKFAGQSIPVLQITGPDEHAAPIVERALDSAVEEDVRSGVVIVRNEPDADGIGEETPLLGKSIDGDSKGGSWFGWMRRRR
jgi:hypothetical protein